MIIKLISQTCMKMIQEMIQIHGIILNNNKIDFPNLYEDGPRSYDYIKY